jgi:NTP pyrophosphatase (non-canonical NTP hydrolase)
MSQDLASLTAQVLAFRDARDWAQFHTSEQLAKCISIEAAELLECYLWKQPAEADTQKVAAELADIFYAVLLMANTLGFDLAEELKKKLAENAEKYPVDKSKGNNKKYDVL